MKRFVFRGVISFVLFCFTFFCICAGVCLSDPIYAENLETESGNYKLLDPQLGSGGGESSSVNFKSLSFIGGGLERGKFSSSLYSVGVGQGYTFMANVPTVACFETQSDGSSSCSSLSGVGGMVQVCGPSGCYDRARFEINPQGNPPDTVYSVQLSPDNWSTILYLDGSSHTLESVLSHNINDYKTLAEWQILDNGTDWSRENILGLTPNTTYRIRLTALNGNYTETGFSPQAIASTAYPYIELDLDIATNSGVETVAPHRVDIGVLGVLAPTAAQNNVYVDFQTNIQSGMSVYVKDEFGGLSNGTYTIVSASEDLANALNGDGFGIKVDSVSQIANNTGYAKATSKYETAGTYQVGGINNSLQKIFCSVKLPTDTCTTYTPAPLISGQGVLKLIGRASLDTPTGIFTDRIIFVGVSNW